MLTLVPNIWSYHNMVLHLVGHLEFHIWSGNFINWPVTEGLGQIIFTIPRTSLPQVFLYKSIHPIFDFNFYCFSPFISLLSFTNTLWSGATNSQKLESKRNKYKLMHQHYYVEPQAAPANFLINGHQFSPSPLFSLVDKYSK